MSLADHTDSQRVAERLKSSTRQLHKLAAQVGHAKQVREYDGDRRKAALSLWAVKALKAGESVSAAEHIARQSSEYHATFEMLAKELEDAETVIAQWTATQASFEASRSLLSFEKATITEL